MGLSFKSFSVSLQLAFWAVLFSVVLYVSASNADIGTALKRIELVFVCHLVTFYACYSIIIPRYFEKKRYLAALFLIFILLAALTPLRVLIERHFASLSALSLNPRRNNGVAFGLIVFSEVAVGAFACLVRLAANSFINQQKIEALRSLHLESELKFLKAQMSPHFLFNTINNIYALTLIQSDKAPVFLLKLSGLLRYLLYGCEKLVTLKEEETALLAFSELYRLRYEEQLQLCVQFEVHQKEKQVEPMLLIPMLENAFKYSGLGINSAAFVKLNIKESDGKLILVCKNSINAQHIKEQTGGIGLNNIKKRLEMAYPGNHVFSIINENGIFTLQLTLPLI